MAIARVSYILPVLLLVVFTGCATTGPAHSSDSAKDVPKALDVALSLRFDDVPVPAGFKVNPTESFIFQNDVLRVGILKYSGTATADQVVSFYKDQMPLYNWRFLNLLEYGRRILNFDREDQTCIIVVEPTKFNTQVTVTVAPKAGRASTYKNPAKERGEETGYKGR